MEIKQVAAAGTLESSDCMIVIKPAEEEGIHIELESIVKTTFGEQIVESVKDVIQGFGISSCAVEINDKGAIDCVIRARAKAAVCRAAGIRYNWKEEDANG